MNTEINLLEQKPKINLVPYFLISIFIVSLITIVFVLLLQRDYYHSQISAEEEYITQMEALLQEYSANSNRQLYEVEQALSFIQKESIPHVSLYDEVKQVLIEAQLDSYVYTGENQIFIDANFPSLKAIADDVSRLSQLNYVVDVEITSTILTGETYEASLSIGLDQDKLRKELGHDRD